MDFNAMEDLLRKILAEAEGEKLPSPLEAKEAIGLASTLLWQIVYNLERSGLNPKGLDADSFAEATLILLETCRTHIQQQLAGQRKSSPNRDIGERGGWDVSTRLESFVRSRWPGVLSNFRKRVKEHAFEQFPDASDDPEVVDRLMHKAGITHGPNWNPEMRVEHRDQIVRAVSFVEDTKRASSKHIVTFGLSKGFYGKPTKASIRAYAKRFGMVLPMRRFTGITIAPEEDDPGLDAEVVGQLVEYTKERVRQIVRQTEQALRHNI